MKINGKTIKGLITREQMNLNSWDRMDPITQKVLDALFALTGKNKSILNSKAAAKKLKMSEKSIFNHKKSGLAKLNNGEKSIAGLKKSLKRK